MNHVTLPPGYIQLTDEVVVRASTITAVVQSPNVAWDPNGGTEIIEPQFGPTNDVTFLRSRKSGALKTLDGYHLSVTHPAGQTIVPDTTLANFTRRMNDAIAEELA